MLVGYRAAAATALSLSAADRRLLLPCLPGLRRRRGKGDDPHHLNAIQFTGPIEWLDATTGRGPLMRL